MRVFICCLLVVNGFISSAQIMISRQNAFSDIDSMNKIIEEVHYNPYLFISKTEYQKKTDSIKSTINDSIELKTFIRKLNILTAFFKDGHTSTSFIQNVLRPQFGKKLFAPFSFITDENNHVFLVNNKLEEIKATDRILSINNKDLTAFAKEIHQYYGGRKEYSKELSDKLFGYLLFLADVQPPYTIKYISGKKVKETVVDSAVTFRTALALNLPNVAGKTYSFNIINNNIGYFDFISMSVNFEVFTKFVDSVMRAVRQNNLPALVIDLRKNSGGNSLLADKFISYFSCKDYTLMGTRYWKISQRYKDQLIASGSTGSNYLKMENGSIWQVGNCSPHRVFTRDSIYKGRVYIITGPFTFSSANMFADGVKKYKLATVIGEPTGEHTNDFGETYSFELPNSKIGITTTTSYDIGADCNKNMVAPVIPDVIIKSTTEQKLNGIDPVLQYIIKKETKL